jgi:colicin import membrane protein
MVEPSSFEHRRPQRPDGMGRGALMALLVHVGLLIALAFGVNWRSSEPVGNSAELWAAVPVAAAPAAVTPPPPPPAPTPAPAPMPRPKPEPKVQAPPPPPPPKPDTRDADIAIEKAKEAEKQKRELEEREKAEKLAREREKAEQLAREQAEKLEREKAAKREQDRLAKLEQEKAARLEQERLAKLEQEKVAKLEREKAEKAKREAAAEAERMAKLREENLKRLQGLAGATGAPQSTGTAMREAGPSANYAGKIVARVRPNIVLTDTVPPTLRAVVEVRAAPDGTITSRRLVKSSGNATWDDAVLRAIDRTSELPKDDNGRVPSSIEIGFTPS